MKCAYCSQEIEEKQVRKTIRGKRHTFCTEYCYILHHYRMPLHDMVDCGGINSVRVSTVPDLKKYIETD